MTKIKTLNVHPMGNGLFVIKADGSPAETVNAYDLCFVIMYAKQRGEHVLNADTKRYITASEEKIRTLANDVYSYLMWNEKAQSGEVSKTMMVRLTRELLVSQAKVGIEVISFVEAADYLTAA